MSKIPIPGQTTGDAMKALAARAKALRLQIGYKRTTLAERSGVSLSSLARFESTGEISLKNLLKLAHALGRLQEFNSLFTPPRFESLDELRKDAEKARPKRGRI